MIAAIDATSTKTPRRLGLPSDKRSDAGIKASRSYSIPAFFRSIIQPSVWKVYPASVSRQLLAAPNEGRGHSWTPQINLGLNAGGIPKTTRYVALSAVQLP